MKKFKNSRLSTDSRTLQTLALKTLLLSLCISDLGVGFLTQPLYVAYLKMEITKNSKKTDNILAYWAVVKAYAIPHSRICFCLIFWCFRDNCWQILGHSSSQSQITCDSQTGCCCSDLILGVQCNCLLLVWIDECFVCDVSCLYHNYRIVLLQGIRSRKTPEKPDSRSARTWTSSSEWRYGNVARLRNTAVATFYMYILFLIFHIYSLFKKYINSCNAKPQLRRQRRRKVQNNNRSN